MSREKVKIISMDEGNYYTMIKFPEGYILKRYSSEIVYPKSKKRNYPKSFKVFEVLGDTFCKTPQDVLNFFKDNYRIELDMTIFE